MDIYKGLPKYGKIFAIKHVFFIFNSSEVASIVNVRKCMTFQEKTIFSSTISVSVKPATHDATTRRDWRVFDVCGYNQPVWIDWGNTQGTTVLDCIMFLCVLLSIRGYIYFLDT